MSSGNNVSLCGTLGRDPELRFTPSGQAVATFGMAMNRRWQDRHTQEWKEDTDWVDVVCWAQLAENVAESITKGTRVVVVGRISQRSWETQDGDKRSKVEIQADDVAPSLKWATATVTRTERRDATNPSGGPGGAAAHPEPKPNTPAPYYDYDEEPF